MMPSTLSRSARPARRAGALLPALLGVILLGAAGVGAYVLLGDDAQGDNAGSTAIHVVEPTTFEIAITASGELEAQQQTEIRSELESPAAIVELIPEGVVAQKGDLLVRLNADEIQKRIDDELLNVASARSEVIAEENAYAIQVADNEANLRQAQLKVELAALELNKWQEGDLVKRLEELDAAIEKAERSVERDRERYEKSQSLFDREFLSKDELVDDRIRYAESQSQLEIARLSKQVFLEYEKKQKDKQLTSDLEEARAELERTKKQNARRLASDEADLTNRRRQLALREERLSKLEKQLAACEITAPTSGLVVYGTSIGNGRGRAMFGGEGGMDIGRNVRPNELILVLPDTSEMVATVRVHESVAGSIEIGHPATVKIEALPGRVLSGSVSSVGVLAESGGWRDPNLREYTVKIALDDEQGVPGLKPSMRCEATIVRGVVQDVLAVPVQAIHRDGPIAYVYTPQGARFQKTPIRLGRRSSTFIEVRDGLQAGDRVLLREPTPGEIIATKFDGEALAAIGMDPERTRSGPPGARRVSRAATPRPAEQGARQNRRSNAEGRSDGDRPSRRDAAKAASNE